LRDEPRHKHASRRTRFGELYKKQYWLIAVSTSATTAAAATISAIATTAASATTDSFGLGPRLVDIDCASTD